MDFSRGFAVIKVAANYAAKSGYAAKMKLFSFCFGFAHIAPPWRDRQTETTALVIAGIKRYNF